VHARLVFNRPVSSAYLHLGVSVPDFPRSFRAGEFVMVRPPWVGDPFLPRAFSIYRISTGEYLASALSGPLPVLEILYKVIGKGTQCLSRMDTGQEVEILGPLGNAFTVSDDVERAVLVAGGIGVPPIAALARQIRNSKFEIRNSDVFLGGKSSEDILCVRDFEEAGARPHITTEDGSLGARGLVTDLVGPFLAAHRSPGTRIFTCGPPGMLAAVSRLAEGLEIPCQVSVEANMACGFGACMGCAVEVRGEAVGYKLVCKDGPVFDSREIVWR